MSSFLRRLDRHLFLAVAVLATGCSGIVPTRGQEAYSPAPTVAPLFLQRTTTTPPPAQAVPGAEAALPLVSLSEGAASPGAPAAGAAQPGTPAATGGQGVRISEVAIYDDVVNPDWSSEHSDGMKYDLADSSHAYSGTVGAAILPEQDLGRFFLTVRPNAGQAYTPERVIGVSLFINSGSEALDPSSLAVTVVGSNDYPYWVPDDHSVKVDDKHFFSESRLYYLGINRPVPPDTWVEAVVWLDALPYEPDYKYITGIYIKNDEGFKRTFYVDQVHLLIAG